MQQVMGYAGGQEGRVMVLAYMVDQAGMVKIWKKLRVDLEAADARLPCLRVAVDQPGSQTAFRTAHAHGSGAEIEIVHVCCHLFQANTVMPASE